MLNQRSVKIKWKYKPEFFQRQTSGRDDKQHQKIKGRLQQRKKPRILGKEALRDTRESDWKKKKRDEGTSRKGSSRVELNPNNKRPNIQKEHIIQIWEENKTRKRKSLAPTNIRGRGNIYEPGERTLDKAGKKKKE
ncbi:hypothetical protein C922_05586 [Plasmodium inui San Antonio 1]|uniref:Uncharacterized protein n=1 Tax=Plasmodium inui San Antonio 1 TaxID=1237626 RepID=W6ZXM4_9APIC|nr:hypothetical protein C922_05586 [Plasmodium inui San Antonio 1]EUD64033.1 hypothetical protein C922_05586 [Plasmodium inui San Antonio 1]